MYTTSIAVHSTTMILMFDMFTFSVAPTITTLDPLQLTVTEPDSATFTCNATARPRPTITWYTDDGSGNRTLLVNGTNNVTIMEQENGDRELISTLTMLPTAPSDATDYVCVAENVVNTDEMTSNLTVYGMYIFVYVCYDNLMYYYYTYGSTGMGRMSHICNTKCSRL